MLLEHGCYPFFSKFKFNFMYKATTFWKGKRSGFLVQVFKSLLIGCYNWVSSTQNHLILGCVK